eukprot:6489358-Amphidinium_carterae.2
MGRYFLFAEFSGHSSLHLHWTMGFVTRYRPMPHPGVVAQSQLDIAHGSQNTWPSSMRLWANLCTRLPLRSWQRTLEAFSLHERGIFRLGCALYWSALTMWQLSTLPFVRDLLWQLLAS